MCDICEFCGEDLVYEANPVPYGDTFADAGGWECVNPDCDGTNQPSCICCGAYEWNSAPMTEIEAGFICELCDLQEVA